MILWFAVNKVEAITFFSRGLGGYEKNYVYKRRISSLERVYFRSFNISFMNFGAPVNDIH